ncbi:alpha/beta hydrolase [Alginatibacterium sediminis]|uniref:Alpha/beta hydrolase n=1 Tax=Alginatibacterium sediminis TaxID=2164068 RepID=A0A420EDP8_9ALTE|nr:alpha/beta hydrolase [Alginatibacterium sediminis]RKF18805.1 alpha/beta hydrolase [Alginatibacterium sediminis]
MLFITNRLPKQSSRSRNGRKFSFDLDNNSVSTSVFFAKRLSDNENTELGNRAFFTELKNSSKRQILLYIHGFSNLPEQIFEAAHELQQLCDAQDQNEVLVVPLIWPCDNDSGIIKDYWDDQKAADASAISFERVLDKFLSWRGSDDDNQDPCLKRINILAHSMGNRVLRQTLQAWKTYELPNGVPMLFRNSFLVAADIVNESLEEGEAGELICHASRNVVVYHASDDLALRASKASNLKHKIASRRLGHSGPENLSLCPSNVYAVDCDDINNSYDFPKGHSYFRYGKNHGQAGVVFKHLYSVLKIGRVFPNDPKRRTMILDDPHS